jgi:hypothetical protein
MIDPQIKQEVLLSLVEWRQANLAIEFADASASNFVVWCMTLDDKDLASKTVPQLLSIYKDWLLVPTTEIKI